MAESVIFPTVFPTLPVLPVTTIPIYDTALQTTKRITPVLMFKPLTANKPVEDKPRETLPVNQPGDNKFLTYIVIGICALIVFNILGKRK